MSKFAAFHDTRNFFIELTGYKKPLTFEEWQQKPDDFKSGLLFIQFYNEITLAWDKADSLDFGDDNEGVSTVLQYLEKQVRQTLYYLKADPTKKAPVEFRRNNPDEVVEVERRTIEENPQKFSGGYIYRIAYNCLYCICGHDRKCDKDRINNETSSIVMYDGEELDLFDTIADTRNSVEYISETLALQNQFWAIVEDCGQPAEKVLRYLQSHDAADLKALSKKHKNYKLDPLGDVEVSLDKVDDIIAELRDKFLSVSIDSPCGQYILQMTCSSVSN